MAISTPLPFPYRLPLLPNQSLTVCSLSANKNPQVTRYTQIRLSPGFCLHLQCLLLSPSESTCIQTHRGARMAVYVLHTAQHILLVSQAQWTQASSDQKAQHRALPLAEEEVNLSVLILQFTTEFACTNTSVTKPTSLCMEDNQLPNCQEEQDCGQLCPSRLACLATAARLRPHSQTCSAQELPCRPLTTPLGVAVQAPHNCWRP